MKDDKNLLILIGFFLMACLLGVLLTTQFGYAILDGLDYKVGLVSMAAVLLGFILLSLLLVSPLVYLLFRKKK